MNHACLFCALSLVRSSELEVPPQEIPPAALFIAIISIAPVLRMDGAEAAKNPKLLWDCARDFNGSPPAAGVQRFGAWERYAQVLLEANEFLFLD